MKGTLGLSVRRAAFRNHHVLARNLLATSALFGMLAMAAPAAAQGGTGYLVPAPAPDNLQKTPRYDCDTPGEPLVSLDVKSKYKQDDASRSTIDEDAEEDYSEAVEPLRDYGKALVKISNAYVKSSPKNTAASACALTWLDSWAKANALTDMRTRQASHNQGQAVGGIALAYLQIRHAPGLPNEQKKRVEAWLNTLGHQVADAMDKNNGVSSRNNHRYWNGLSAIAAGIATGDQKLIKWGAESARIGIRQITKDGTLPLELKRAKRARDYHNFAAEPLIATAELARTQGIDLYAENDKALSRLVNRVVESFTDPSFFEKATGSKQEPYSGDGTVPDSRIAWLEIYQSRFPSEKAEALLASRRPVASSGIGGNTTLLFRGKD
ncbi:alginate lyase family protein [Microvirga sp. G4-2]|uniref:alginate lyase family protein n=1 Tax=Microvirga sp. G4-2 TaxID=3434467 RepID=UPI0040444FE0